MSDIEGRSPPGQNGGDRKIGVMVCGHGSRNRRAVAEFAVLSERLKVAFPDWPVDYGYLEFAKPVLHEGLDRLVAAGCTRILAVPGMLFAAGHAKNDIPSVLNAYAARRRQVDPHFTIEYGRDLGIDPKMLQAASERIGAALAGAPDVPAAETLLVVVGRGASDPDANGNVAKITRLMWESFGFGWAETAYSGVTFPLVEPALERAVRLGFRRIVVFPYFLFTGVLVGRIYAATDVVAARHKDIEFIKADYLNDHPAVIETFIERVGEIISGDTAMNCQMCKYRAQIPAFEADVGLPQESHHHHVEGVSAGCDLCDPDGTCNGRCQQEVHGHGAGHHHSHDGAHGHSHDGRSDDGEHGHSHDHDHGDGHGHPVYPHADHPLGPKTLKSGAGRSSAAGRPDKTG